METNLVNAYKSLSAVLADPNLDKLGPANMAEEVRAMQSKLRWALVTIHQKRAAAEVDAMLAQ